MGLLVVGVLGEQPVQVVRGDDGMNTHGPDHETLRAAVALATRAPPVDNTQPWRWSIGDESIHLHADWTRQLPAIDPDGRDLVIRCGAALHHLRTALAALGWHTTVHRIPNLDQPHHLAAVEFSPHDPTDRDVALAATISRRRTDWTWLFELNATEPMPLLSLLPPVS